MSRGRVGWRTGSPDRLNDLVGAQSWNLFGVAAAPPAPAQAPAYRSLGAASAAPAQPPDPPVGSSFVPPAWCVAPNPPSKAQLAVYRGAPPQRVSAFRIGHQRCLVAGRSPDVELVLEHPSASRRHAALLFHRSGALYLVDLGSAHGTFLDGERLPPQEPTLWPDGARCVFGASPATFVLELGGAAAPPQAVYRGLAASAPATADGDGDEDDGDDECERNTLANTRIEPETTPPRRAAGGGKRVRISFEPPRVWLFEPASPEPLLDPEAKRDGAAPPPPPAAAPAPAPAATSGLARPTSTVTITKRGRAAAAGDPGAWVDHRRTAADEAPPAADGAAKRKFAKERWVPRSSRPAAARIDVETHGASAAAAVVASEGAAITVSSAEGALFELVWRDARLNPMKPASSPVVYGGGGGAVRVGSAAAAVRPLPSEGGRAVPLELSVVNCQPRALFVYAALRPPGGTADERALTPWEGAAAPADRPVALTEAGARRGANCLLLAPWEGQPHCLADDAETAPFGATNTFRFDAATGAPAELAADADLRIEAAFQQQGAAGDDAPPEPPFCCLTVPVRFAASG